MYTKRSTRISLSFSCLQAFLETFIKDKLVESGLGLLRRLHQGPVSVTTATRERPDHNTPSIK